MITIVIVADHVSNCRLSFMSNRSTSLIMNYSCDNSHNSDNAQYHKGTRNVVVYIVNITSITLCMCCGYTALPSQS